MVGGGGSLVILHSHPIIHTYNTHRYFNISCSWSHFPQIAATTRQSSFLNHIFSSLCPLPCFYVLRYLFVACFTVILPFIWLLLPFIDCLCSWCTWNMCVCVCVLCVHLVCTCTCLWRDRWRIYFWNGTGLKRRGTGLKRRGLLSRYAHSRWSALLTVVYFLEPCWWSCLWIDAARKQVELLARLLCCISMDEN